MGAWNAWCYHHNHDHRHSEADHPPVVGRLRCDLLRGPNGRDTQGWAVVGVVVGGGGAAIGFFQAGEAVSPPMSQLKRACAKDGNAPANREEVAGVAVALLGNCSPDARRSQFSYPLPTPPRSTPTHIHPAPRRAYRHHIAYRMT
jgi:hypothetical protein